MSRPLIIHERRTNRSAEPAGLREAKRHPGFEIRKKTDGEIGSTDIRRPDWVDSQLYPFEDRWMFLDGHRVHYVDEGPRMLRSFSSFTPGPDGASLTGTISNS